MPFVAPETEFATLGFWPDQAVKRLRDRWITTVEQVVGVAATPDGVIALVNETGLAKGELLRLLALTRAALPPDVRRELSQPADTSLYGTGALAPPLKTGQ